MRNDFQIKVPPPHTFEGNKEREKPKSGTSYLFYCAKPRQSFDMTSDTNTRVLVGWVIPGVAVFLGASADSVRKGVYEH